ncbi:MAG: hypothetical protein AMK75_07160 [Planctomycetes bacterium SM23_65]|nr:MAG: hypothetical protein AMK75_07160 [Planctomycetes bacterium SM23_65]
MPADGRALRGFTLTELLAVLTIALVLIAGSIGVWVVLAESIGPGQATVVVQAMLVGARDFAVTNSVMTRVVFVNDLANVDTGTMMYLEYDEMPATNGFQKKRVPGRSPEYAGRQLFVLKGAPNLPPAPSVAADERNPDASVVEKWQEYRDDVSGELAKFATGGTGYLGNSFSLGEFYVTFDETGTLAADVNPENPSVLTIIQAPGPGRRVGEYQFYILNSNTGTRLVFE